jgi:hypothetical protein
VPEELKTAELCLLAVESNDRALQYVPEKFKTLKLCLAAVEQNGHVFKCVPEKLREQVKKEAKMNVQLWSASRGLLPSDFSV